MSARGGADLVGPTLIVRNLDSKELASSTLLQSPGARVIGENQICRLERSACLANDSPDRSDPRWSGKVAREAQRLRRERWASTPATGASAPTDNSPFACPKAPVAPAAASARNGLVRFSPRRRLRRSIFAGGSHDPDRSPTPRVGGDEILGGVVGDVDEGVRLRHGPLDRLEARRARLPERAPAERVRVDDMAEAGAMPSAATLACCTCAKPSVSSPSGHARRSAPAPRSRPRRAPARGRGCDTTSTSRATVALSAACPIAARAGIEDIAAPARVEQVTSVARDRRAPTPLGPPPRRAQAAAGIARLGIERVVEIEDEAQSDLISCRRRRSVRRRSAAWRGFAPGDAVEIIRAARRALPAAAIWDSWRRHARSADSRRRSGH